MLQLALTTDVCKKVMEAVLRRRGWSMTRIARAIKAPSEYLKRVQSGQQSFQVSDVELLAKALGRHSYELIFESMDRDELSAKGRQLYDLTLAEVERHRKFEKVMSRKPGKARRARSATAA